MAGTLNKDDKRHIQVGLRSNAIGAKVYTMLDEGEEQGVVSSCTLLFANQPTTTDTVTIGADVYEFVTAAGQVADDANLAVEIKGSAALTLVELVAGVNAADANNQHANINNVADDTPALVNGTENLVADVIGTTMRIRSADAPGGNVVSGNPSIVLAEAITDAADIWDVGDVNMNTLSGRDQDNKRTAVAEVTITAAMITNDLRVDFPFVPVRWSAEVHTSAGVVRPAGTDAYTIGSSGIVVAFGGGASPDIQATDVLVLQAWS